MCIVTIDNAVRVKKPLILKISFKRKQTILSAFLYWLCIKMIRFWIYGVDKILKLIAPLKKNFLMAENLKLHRLAFVAPSYISIRHHSTRIFFYWSPTSILSHGFLNEILKIKCQDCRKLRIARSCESGIFMI